MPETHRNTLFDTICYELFSVFDIFELLIFKLVYRVCIWSPFRKSARGDQQARTLCAIMSLHWLVTGDYDLFVRAQPDDVRYPRLHCIGLLVPARAP